MNRSVKIEFTKMQGLGNDFVVIDATEKPFALSPAQIQKMANRRLGVGFDQLLVIEPPKHKNSDFNFRIFNADGSEVGQCGNGARCMARFIRESGLSQQSSIRLSTLTDVLHLTIEPDDKITVSMGIPRFKPEEIPFVAQEVANFYEMELKGQRLKLSVVNIGNPHAIISVSRIDAQQVIEIGGILSKHERFPEGTNVGFMQVLDPLNIRLRVFERGTGETLACGSSACAAMAVGRRNGWLQERVNVSQPGGTLIIEWQGPDTAIRMTGPAATVFQGTWTV